MPKKNTPHLSIVIPTYNEAGNIEKVIESSYKEAKKLTNDFEIIICDDGSTDTTSEIVKKYQKKILQLRLIVNKPNRGLGPTLIRLFNESKGDFIQIFPGDYQARPKELPKFYQAIQNADLVCGYRQKRKDSIYRLIISKIYNICVRLMFGIKVHDVGTIKMIRHDALKKIKPESRTNFIETELVIKTYQKGLRIVEVPIKQYPRKYGKGTGARISIAIKVFANLFKYFLFGKI